MLNILKQTRNVFVPYVIYSFLAWALKMLVGQAAVCDLIGILNGDSPNPVLWFLWTLYFAIIISFCLGWVLNKITNKNKEEILLCIGILLYFLSNSFELNFINKLMSSFIYVYVGLIIRKYYDIYLKFIKKLF